MRFENSLDAAFIARTIHDFLFLLGAFGFISILLNQMSRAKLKSDGPWTN
jgi:preprotein translocase subunit SecF